MKEVRPENKTQETKTFSNDSLKKEIKTILGSIKEVKKINSVEVGGLSDIVSLSLNITVEKYFKSINIETHIILKNEERGIAVIIHSIDAGNFTKKVKEKLNPELKKIPEKIKSYIEKEEGKKIEKIEIINGELKITFSGALEPVKVKPSEALEPKTSKQGVKSGPKMKMNLNPETNLNQKLKKDITEEKKGREEKEKAETLKKLQETIENSKRILEENKIKKEALLKELEGLNNL